MSGSNSAVECQLPKLDVAGSIPVSRSSSDKNPSGLAEHTKRSLDAYMALMRMYYNFVRPHMALKFGKVLRTPCMQAGLVTKRLSFIEIFTAFFLFFIAAVAGNCGLAFRQSRQGFFKGVGKTQQHFPGKAPEML